MVPHSHLVVTTPHTAVSTRHIDMVRFGTMLRITDLAELAGRAALHGCQGNANLR